MATSNIFDKNLLVDLIGQNRFKMFLNVFLTDNLEVENLFPIQFIFQVTIFPKNRKNFLKRRLRRRFPALRAGNLAIEPPKGYNRTIEPP